MKATELRQSILQMAVQGKLVPQDLHDETASELLARIKAEKAKLIKEGKIKKEKPLPPIIEDEIPYDLPEGWIWCRLGDICLKLTDGAHSTPKYVDCGVPFLSVRDISGGKIDFSSTKFITEEEHNELYKRCNPQKGDLLLTKVGTTGIPVIVDTDQEFSLFVSVALLKISQQNINLKYLQYLIQSPLVYQQSQENTRGVGNKNWVLTAIANTLLTIPPLAEQQRIVAKVDELMAMCDELEAAEKELEKLESDFIEYLPKSILQMAVQGKLVPQNIHYEPADKLLERIRVEKTQLIKDGKLKKEKPLPPITEDDIPYDLPDGWVWCRLGALIVLLSGRDLAPNQYNDQQQGIPYITGASAIDGDEILVNRWTTEQAVVSNIDDLLISCKGTVGKLVFNNIGDCHIARQIMALRFFSNNIDKEYIKVFLMSYVQQLIIRAKSMIPGISREDVLYSLIPVPPIAEQQRIVAKVDELMALCDELKAAKKISISPLTSKVIPFPAQDDTEGEEIRIAARGDIQDLSDEAMRDIDELFGDDSHD